MALPTKVLPGFSATLYAQPSATPTPITTANLSVLGSISPLAVSGNLVPVEAIPAFGQDDGIFFPGQVHAGTIDFDGFCVEVHSQLSSADDRLAVAL